MKHILCSTLHPQPKVNVESEHAAGIGVLAVAAAVDDVVVAIRHHRRE